MTTQLQQMPAVAPAMIAALTTVRRRPREDTVVPDLGTRIDGVRADPDKLYGYRQVCGFAAATSLPVTYPQVLAAPVHLQMMIRNGFPIPLLGMVHVRNRIEQLRPIDALETLSFEIDVGQLRRVKAGLELDVRTRCSADGYSEPVWQSTMTVLHRVREKREDGPGKPAPAVPAPLVESTQTVQIEAPEDTGRRYARVAGDYNPIHLHPLSARLFGFKHAIAHGMWTLARCCAELEMALAAPIGEVEAAFKRPLLLPGHASLKWTESEQGVEYGLLGRQLGEVHLLGHLRTALR